LNNVKFIGSDETQRRLCIARFIKVLTHFNSLESLSMEGVNNAPFVFKALAM
jgi:hypothetical protein